MSVGWPAISDSTCACVPPNHSVAPSSRGISVPIFIAMFFTYRVWERGVRPRSQQKLLAVERLLAGLPFSLAESAGLQRLNHAQRFFRRAADVQIVHDLVTQH